MKDCVINAVLQAKDLKNGDFLSKSLVIFSDFDAQLHKSIDTKIIVVNFIIDLNEFLIFTSCKNTTKLQAIIKPK